MAFLPSGVQGVRGGEQYGSLKVGGGGGGEDEGWGGEVAGGGRGTGREGRGVRSVFWRPPPWLIELPSMWQWEGVPLNNGSGEEWFLPVLCPAGRKQIGFSICWTGWSWGWAWNWLPGGVDHHFSTVELEERHEAACPSSVCIQSPVRPLQLVVHIIDTGGLSMAVDHPAPRPSLHSLNFFMFLAVYGPRHCN